MWSLVILVAFAGLQGPAHITAFVDVTVVPLDTERTVPHQTVLVKDGTIAVIGPADSVQVPPGAVRVDGRGRFLMPGLTDMHVHLFDSGDLLLYLAHGVTTIRNLGGYGSADSILEIRRQVAAGERLGPTVFTSGNWLDGDPPFRPINTVLRTPAEARDEVRREKRLGYDYVKVYATLQPDVYQEILHTAREEGIAVTGHVPGPVGLDAVLAGGQVAVDHVANLVTAGSGSRAESPEALARRVHEAGVAVTTTLVMARIAAVLRGSPEHLDSMLARPEARWLSGETREFWRRAPFLSLPRDGSGEALYTSTATMARALEDAHAQLLAGTDAGLWGNVPGASLLAELHLLVQAGLTPYQALRAATAEPARFLERTVRGARQPGALAVGNRADLLLLEADPLQNIGAIDRRAGVMVRGSWLSRERLDSMVERLAAARAAGPASSKQ
jgi:imidazolonepropionase-like amidohydrolase